jgi:hypothetical protein
MGECGCAELSPHEVVSIGDNVLAIEIYPGCRDCHTPMALTLYFFTPEGADEFVLKPTRSLVPNQYGLEEGWLSFPLIDPQKLVQVARDLGVGEEEEADWWIEENARELVQETWRRTINEYNALDAED